ncbi:MAG: hypothetical protein WBS33_17950 [Verrucomicrobiia bacterium]
MKNINLILLFGLFLTLLSGCGSFEGETSQINPGDSRKQVLAIMGAPGDRQFQNDNEVWQYRKMRLGGFNFSAIWFYDGKVTGISRYTQWGSSLSAATTFKPVRWENAPSTDENGNLSADAQRQAIIQQNLAFQQRLIQNNINSLQQSAAESQRTADKLELQMNLPPVQQNQPAQQPSLPAAYDMPKSSDFQTGNTRLGPDGRMWHEYRTITGYNYWRLDQGIQ